jgi:hypothetical protein
MKRLTCGHNSEIIQWKDQSIYMKSFCKQNDKRSLLRLRKFKIGPVLNFVGIFTYF